VSSAASAGFWRRFAALVYDAFAVSAVLMLFTGVLVAIAGTDITYETVGAWVYPYHMALFALIALYTVLNWSRSGQTLGMRAWRLRAVEDDGKPLRVRRGVTRFLLGILAWAPAALGVLWMYLDSEHLALHDRLSRTRVIRLGRA
jgi:uncharacterized RDD family membrane protein YckC